MDTLWCLLNLSLCPAGCMTIKANLWFVELSWITKQCFVSDAVAMRGGGGDRAYERCDCALSNVSGKK